MFGFWSFLASDSLCDGDLSRQGLRQRASNLVKRLVSDSTTSDGSVELQMAACLGYLQLVAGDSPPEQLLHRCVEPAARRLLQILNECVPIAEKLRTQWESDDTDEAEQMVAQLLKMRMEAWATMEAFHSLKDQSGVAALISDCESRCDAFDQALLDHIVYLTTIVDTPLLATWRRALAAEQQVVLPWWLGGMIEAESVQLDRTIDVMKEEILELTSGTKPTSSSVVDAGRPRRQLDMFPGKSDVGRGEGTGTDSPASYQIALQITKAAGQGDETTSGTPSIRGLSVAWLSEDRSIRARLQPSDSSPRVFEIVFEPEGHPSECRQLLGFVVVLGADGAAIQLKEVAGRDVAIAEFPWETLRDACATSQQVIPPLFVMPAGGKWEPVGMDG